MRTGVDPSGHELSKGMPWQPIGRMSDEELSAVYEYLTHFAEFLKVMAHREPGSGHRSANGHRSLRAMSAIPKITVVIAVIESAIRS